MRYKLGGFLLIAGIVFTFFDGIYYLMPLVQLNLEKVMKIEFSKEHH